MKHVNLDALALLALLVIVAFFIGSVVPLYVALGVAGWNVIVQPNIDVLKDRRNAKRNPSRYRLR